MNPTIVTPATPIIDLARAKLHCKFSTTFTARDAEVADAILTAQAWVQEELRVAIGPQRLKFTYDQWAGCATLPFEITAVVSVDDTSGPVPYTRAGRVITAAGTAPVSIVIDCGLAAEAVPHPVKWAMLLVIGDLMENPYAQTEVQLYENPAAENLLALYRERRPL